MLRKCVPVVQPETLNSALWRTVRCAPIHGAPVTRRARCRAGSERVQRDRVGKFGLGHAWVANESLTLSNPKPLRVVRMFSFGDEKFKSFNVLVA